MSANDMLEVEGGRPLVGEVRLAGAKNAATKLMVASLLTAEPVTIDNIPDLGDTSVTAELLAHVGTTINRLGQQWTLTTADVRQAQVPPLSRRNRIPILALGPLLHRAGEAEVPLLGGDRIGARPVNWHLAALQLLGADIEVTPDRVRARAQRLRGASITLPYPSVGATENIILTAVLATGRTVIRGAAVEPEVADLVQMLRGMGARIDCPDSREVVIDGVGTLHGTNYRVMPDRNEAVSFSCLAYATGGDITVREARPKDLAAWLAAVRRFGGQYEIGAGGIRFFGRRPWRGIKVETEPHPGFMTDWQQPLAVVLTQAAGPSTIHETVYEDRFGYLQSVAAMGAEVATSSDCWGRQPCRWVNRGFIHSCRLHGPRRLHGGVLTMPDIRAGMAHLIAALAAEGQSELTGLEHLARGYQALPDRLRSVGARLAVIRRVY